MQTVTIQLTDDEYADLQKRMRKVEGEKPADLAEYILSLALGV